MLSWVEQRIEAAFDQMKEDFQSNMLAFATQRKALRQATENNRRELHQGLAEQREQLHAALADQQVQLHAALAEQQVQLHSALADQRQQLNAALVNQEQRLERSIKTYGRRADRALRKQEQQIRSHREATEKLIRETFSIFGELDESQDLQKQLEALQARVEHLEKRPPAA